MVRILNIDKPSGWTSFSVIHFLKKKLEIKKAGHLGTLDPLASGVLPVFIGKATKLIPYFNEGDKVYRAQIILGIRTDTFDAEGEITEKNNIKHIQTTVVEHTVKTFLGTHEQRVPPFSAMKIDGKRSYDLARNGKPVPMTLKTVKFKDLKIEKILLPLISIKIRCSKGTYIRSFAEELGMKLKVGAHLSGLTRLMCGPWFQIENAFHPEMIAANNPESIPWIDPLELLKDWTTIVINEKEYLRLQNGQKLYLSGQITQSLKNSKEQAKVIDKSNNLVAVGHLICDNDNVHFKPSRVLV